jgi:aminoglycoside phosphotransferase (APT) family kinase protein
MCAERMHAGEVDIDVSLVRPLLAAQFPHWADRPVEPVESAGTDNALYRLGGDMAVRLPRIEQAVTNVGKEHRWLARLAPLLPVAVPGPLRPPTEDYPWPWSVYRWLEGENPVVGHLAEPGLLARDLAGFITALRRIDITAAPLAGRGIPLATRECRPERRSRTCAEAPIPAR